MQYELRGLLNDGGRSLLVGSISVDEAREALKVGSVEAVRTSSGGRVVYFRMAIPPLPPMDLVRRRSHSIRPQCEHTVQAKRYGPGTLPSRSPSQNIKDEIRHASRS